MNKQTKTFSFIIISSIIGGAIPIFSKLALTQIAALPLTFIRFFLALIILLPIFFILKRSMRRLFKFKALAVSFFGALNITLFTIGLTYTSAASAQMLYAGAPLIVGIFSHYYLNNKLSAQKICGVLLGLLGILVIILLPLAGTNNFILGELKGNIMVLIGVISFATYLVLSKKLQTEYSPFELNLSLAVITVILQVFLSPMWIKHIPNFQLLAWQTILSILYLSIIGTAFYYFIYQKTIKETSALVASMNLYLQPIITVSLAVALLNEKISAGFLLGAGLALIGVAIVRKSENA